MSGSRPRFEVINGSGASQSASVVRDFVVLEHRTIEPQQLTLALWASGTSVERLLSVGIEGLTFEVFRQVLLNAGVRYVVDIRHLASFRGGGFSASLVASMFVEFGITYERSFALANRYTGSSRNPHSVLERYAEHLRHEQQGAIEMLAQYLRNGPVLLLGTARQHTGTEREVVVELLAEHHLPLELLTLIEVPHSSSRPTWSLSLLGSPPGVDGETRAQKRRKTRGDTHKQLPLLSVDQDDET